MTLAPTRTDLVSHAVRADERVRSVAPVSSVAPAATTEGGPEREAARPAFTAFRNEELVERYRGASVPPENEGALSRMAGRAVNAYASVYLVNERDAVADMLGVSLYV